MKELPDHLRELLKGCRPVSKTGLKRLARAGRNWWKDASERTEYHTAIFVSDISTAMTRRHMSRSELARRVGCSRQHLSRLLDCDRRANFTIKTMVKLTIALGLDLSINARGKLP